jgi:hypothetical protein
MLSVEMLSVEVAELAGVHDRCSFDQHCVLKYYFLGSFVFLIFFVFFVFLLFFDFLLFFILSVTPQQKVVLYEVHWHSRHCLPHNV